MLHLSNRVLRRYSPGETRDLPPFIFVGRLCIPDESEGKKIFSVVIKQIFPDYLDKIRGNRIYSLGEVNICLSASV